MRQIFQHITFPPKFDLEQKATGQSWWFLCIPRGHFPHCCQNARSWSNIWRYEAFLPNFDLSTLVWHIKRSEVQSDCLIDTHTFCLIEFLGVTFHYGSSLKAQGATSKQIWVSFAKFWPFNLTLTLKIRSDV